MISSNVALVVGNGKSRLQTDLNCFKNSIPIIGCNAIYRDFQVDHLVCCDKRMVEEALTPQDHLFPIYTRERYYRDYKKILKFKRVKLVPDLPYTGERKQDQPEHWGSGPYAVLLAASMSFQKIILIGFDLYGDSFLVNNVYAGTKNYSKESSAAVDFTFWIYQINKVFIHYPKKEFIIINNNNWKIPKEWIKDNVRFIGTENISNTIDSELNRAYNT